MKQGNIHFLHYLSVTIVCLLLASCAGQAVALTPPPAPTRTLPLPTLATTPSPEKVEPTPTALRMTWITPDLTAYRLFFDSWSPDSQWIGLWEQAGDGARYTLVFLNRHTGETCHHPEVAYGPEVGGGTLNWTTGDAITVRLRNAPAMTGTPCMPFTATGEVMDPFAAQPLASPDGSQTALTEYIGYTEQLSHNRTTILDEDGNEIWVYDWDASIHIRSYKGWLNNDLYLVGIVLENTLLYYDLANQRRGNILSDILQITPVKDEYFNYLTYLNDQNQADFHLLIASSLKTYFYHSESKTTEILWDDPNPVLGFACFSADGNWLILRDLSSPFSLQVRAVDPPASDWRYITDTYRYNNCYPYTDPQTGAQAVILYSGAVHIRLVPSGELVKSWAASGGGYALYVQEPFISPDGTALVAMGNNNFSQVMGVFLIEP